MFLGVIAIVAIVATGAGYWVSHDALNGITVSQALTPQDPRSTGNSMNILLIGLDSRKDQNGNDLPASILKHLHAGDSDDGGYNTNTLILVHVGADGKSVAFSIPRDDWVAFSGVPGYDHIKIKEAYGLTKQYVAQKLADQGTSSQKELETKGREAARAATLRAVRSLTGLPIDYFAEVNLAGFYDLAQTLGGVEVCLNHPVQDSYSGANFPAGRQRLNASQALAFVRQRHGLDNGDLDRTHRQQAFLSSVMRELQDSGTFTNLDRLDNLMSVARKDVVLSAGWDENLVRRMGELGGGNVEFITLPVVRYDEIDGQSVNIIDPAAIKAEIAEAIGTTVAAPSTTSARPKPDPGTVVDVVNAGSLTGLATRVSRALTKQGYTLGQVRDHSPGDANVTAITFGKGAETEARDLAVALGIDTPVRADSTLAPKHITVTVDTDYALPDTEDTTSSTPTSSTSSTSSKSGTSSSSTTSSTSGTETTTSRSSRGYSNQHSSSTFPTPDQGKPIDGGGVPCVN